MALLLALGALSPGKAHKIRLISMDIQLTNPSRPAGEAIFVESEIRDGALVFTAETLLFDFEEQENNTLAPIEVIAADDFSMWWKLVHLQGWRICP